MKITTPLSDSLLYSQLDSQCEYKNTGIRKSGLLTTLLLPVIIGFSGLFAAFNASADPVVNGNRISWPESGWVQVQSAEDFRTLCQGEPFCDVPPGTYHVINFGTGTRFENIVVGGNASESSLGAPTTAEPVNASGTGRRIAISDVVFVEGNTISWTDDGWYQVQRASDFVTLCNGERSCTVSNGTYIVINHSNGRRLNNVPVGTPSSGQSASGTSGGVVAAGSASGDEFQIEGNRITFTGNGWYQVQRADNFSTVCQGEPSCDLAAGTYNVINHNGGRRFNGVVIGGANSSTSAGGNASEGSDNSTEGSATPAPQTPSNGVPPRVVGNEIIFGDSGWYQVQQAESLATVCQGNISRCSAGNGVYTVINHSIGARYEGVRVGAAPVQAPPIYTINASDPFNASLETIRSPIRSDGRPSQPRNLRVELIANDWVEFNWTPSVDDGQVVAYNIYRDSTNEPLYVLSRSLTHTNSGIAAELAKYWETTSFIDCNRTRFSDAVFFCDGGPNGEPAKGPQTGARHVYYVSSVDNSGNESPLSDALTVQLHADFGATLQDYSDPHLVSRNGFPFNTPLSQPSSYLDQFQMVFSEEFNGASLDPEKWNTRLLWGPDVTINGEKQYFVDSLRQPNFGYNPFQFTGSTLKISAQQTPASLRSQANNKPYLSGALSSHDRFGFTYGYVESRMKVSGVFGALSTFYLYHRYPGDHGPEIDIMEYLGYNQFGDEDVFQTYHYRDQDYANNRLIRSSPTMSERNSSGAQYSDAFHTYGVLWEPGLVIWYIDGVEVKRLHGPQVGRRQMNLVAYLVTGSVWAPAPNEYSPADEVVERHTDEIVNLPFTLEADNNPVEMEIDYIRVWQLPERRG